MLMNFTIGMFGAVVGFIWTLVSVIKACLPDQHHCGARMFAFAALAAVSFGVTWLLALYAAATGTVYDVARRRQDDGQQHEAAERPRRWASAAE